MRCLILSLLLGLPPQAPPALPPQAPPPEPPAVVPRRLPAGRAWTHTHRCRSCGAEWAHTDAAFGNRAAHACSACGRVEFGNVVRRGWSQAPQARQGGWVTGRALQSTLQSTGAANCPT